MAQYAHDLNLLTPLFKAEIDPFLFPKVRHTRLGLEVLSNDIIQLFDRLNLKINLVEVFYSRPFLTSGIHIDSSGGDINKINWVFGGAECEMNWYSVNQHSAAKEIKNTMIGTDYLQFATNEVTLEASKVLHSPSLVHVGIPHNVQNKSQDRWCVSVVYKTKDTDRRPTMAQSLEIFKEFVK